MNIALNKHGLHKEICAAVFTVVHGNKSNAKMLRPLKEEELTKFRKSFVELDSMIFLSGSEPEQKGLAISCCCSLLQLSFLCWR